MTPGPKKIIVMTCNVCNTRQSKIISTTAYEQGVVIIRCTSCDSKHLIADNLGYFGSSARNIEDIMREKGEDVVHVSAEGDLEWEPNEDGEGGGRATLRFDDVAAERRGKDDE